MEKRATVIDSIKTSAENLLLIDTGDILGAGINPRRHNYIAKAYEFLQYDIWTPGDQDFIEGTKLFFNSLIPAFKTTLNTNLIIENKKFGVPYVIKNYKDIRLGFTSTITKDVEDYISPIKKMSVKVEDPMETLKPVINQLRSKSDIIILLSHSGYDNDVKLAKRFKDIDLIIGAHSQTLLKEPDKVDDTYIAQAGKAGYRLGVLNLKISNNQIDEIDNTLILLDKKIKNHEGMMNIIKQYKNRTKN